MFDFQGYGLTLKPRHSSSPILSCHQSSAAWCEDMYVCCSKWHDRPSVWIIVCLSSPLPSCLFFLFSLGPSMLAPLCHSQQRWEWSSSIMTPVPSCWRNSLQKWCKVWERVSLSLPKLCDVTKAHTVTTEGFWL